jgi:DNA-binding NtrC family response regulator
LRERTDDILPLINHFRNEFVENSYKGRFEFDGDVMQFLHNYAWPGNVRELKNVVGRLMLLGDWDTLKEELLGRDTSKITGLAKEGVAEDLEAPEQKTFPPLKEVKKRAVQEAESKLISAVLKETGWNRKKAAKILQISYKALLYKIKELDLDKNK